MMQETRPSAVTGTPRTILCAEGGVIAAAALIFAFSTGLSWWLLVILILAPDLSMLGYLKSARVGTWAYNLAHTYVVPVLLLIIAWQITAPVLTHVALIWIAHIGFDRLIGYGLKYETAFRHTHLSRL